MRKLKIKKTTIKNNLPLIVVFSLLLVLGISSVVFAQVVKSKETTILEIVNALKSASPEDKEILLATLKEESSGFIGAAAVGGVCKADGSDPVSQLCNINILDLEVEDFTATGTTTPAVSTYHSVRKTSTVPAATSTLDVAADGTNITIELNSYTNTGADKVCSVPNSFIDLLTATRNITLSIGVGTTTALGDYSWTNTTTATVIASTTIATGRTTVTSGFVTGDASPGSGLGRQPDGTASTTQFLLLNGESLVWWAHSFNATSAASFSNENLGALSGRLDAACKAR